VRRGASGPRVQTRATMAILPSQRTSRVPQFRSPLLPSLVTTSAWCFQKVIWCASITLGPYSSSYLCSPRPSISLTLHPIAVPPSPTSPSPTQAPSIALMLSMAKLIVHRHVLIAFLRFPFVNLAHPNITVSHCLSPNVALNPPSSSPSPYPRRHVFVASIAVSTSGHHFSSSSKDHPWSIIICPRQTTGPSYSPSTSSTRITPATCSATVTPTQVTLTSTIASAATTMTPSGVARPLSQP